MAVAAWMGVIFLLSGQSTLPSIWERADLQDIAGHFLVFAVLTLLLRWALAGAGMARPGAWALAAAVLYGLSDEFHQSFVPGRHPDPFDVFIDGCGAAAALLALKVYALTRPAPAVSNSTPLG